MFNLLKPTSKVSENSMYNMGVKNFFNDTKNKTQFDKKLRSLDATGKLVASVAGAATVVMTISLISKAFFMGLTILALAGLTLIGRDLVIVAKNSKKMAQASEEEKKQWFVEKNQIKTDHIKRFVNRLFENTWILESRFTNLTIYALSQKSAHAASY